MVHDFVYEPPTPQIDTGTMRGSWWISAGQNILQTSINKKSSVTITSPDTRGAENDELRVGFMVPYAEIQESGMRDGKKIKPGQKTIQAGNAAPGWIRFKLKRNQAKYMRLLEEFYLDNL